MPRSTANSESSISALEDYFKWEYEAWVEILADLEQEAKEHFLPLDAVRSYFTTCDSQLQRNLDKMLVEIFNMDPPPVNSDLILRDHTAIFCILLQIEREIYIKHFTCFEELSDQRLPFDLAHPPQPFPINKGDSMFFQEFCEVQRRYCVPIFNPHMLHKNFGNQRLLPITSKERLRTRGKSTAHIITIYGPHNKITRESVKIKNPNSNTFVIKSYSTTQAHSSYIMQVNAFRSIKNADGVLKFFGSFEYRGQSHILLEFADKGTLRDFFRTEVPPTRGDHIIDFWDNILQLTKGLKAIQSVKGSHNDICSENILVQSNGTRLSSNWQFKFSGPGIVSDYENNFEQIAWTSSSEKLQNESNFQDTRPLVNGDIWRLGCVFSQAAFWVADGYKGVLDFERKLGDNVDISKHLQLHEEKQVSENIMDAHTEIENHLRRSDYVTKDVLSSMVDEMLWHEDHPNIEVLIQKAENIIATARQSIAEVSTKNSSRRRSQSRHTSRASSLAPPMPLLLSKSNTEISSTKAKSRFPKRCGSLRIDFNDYSGSLSNTSPAIISTKNNTSRIKTTNLYTFNSMSEKNSGTEGDNTATSWFLESPTAECPITPIVSPVRVRKCHSQSSKLDHISHIETIGVNLPFEPYRLMNQGSKETYVNDTKRALHLNEEMEKRSNYEVRLPSGLKKLPPHDSTPKHRSPPLSFHNSQLKNIESEDITSQCPSYESLSESHRQHLSLFTSTAPKPHYEEINLQSRPQTSINTKHHNSIRRPHLENETYQRTCNLSDHPIYSTLTNPVISNDHSCNESISSSACSSLTNNSVGSVIRPKNSRLSSFNSRRGSLRSVQENSFPLSRTSTACSTFYQSFNEVHDQNKIAHIDINTCRYWKHLNKTSRRKSRVPLLPGAHLLLPLKKHDHVFIVDDSVSMAPHWPEVCLVFESLSYIVKGMSPLGTQLYFTISSESLKKKGTHDLCHFVSEKQLQRAQTNIAKRLDLLLAAYRIKLWDSNKRARDVRPVNFYILSNGIWAPESFESLKNTLEQTAILLSQFGLKNQVYLSFIGFDSATAAARSIEALSLIDWGGGLRIRWSWWTGNIWGMLRGDLVNIDRNSSSLGNTSKISMDGKNYSQNLIFENAAIRDDFNKTPIIEEVEGLYELA
ncbi:putative protein kinase-like [Erysiphe neolycopersici]|uniref:Protein kinase domain-containing protein n=1 Tax=Erysiphe neolycopersici TaxID=212602 RepID=A0A420HFK8_9PEZI|nr:putative protein kinase-like [Erysiphe neolycopersici]